MTQATFETVSPILADSDGSIYRFRNAISSLGLERIGSGMYASVFRVDDHSVFKVGFQAHDGWLPFAYWCAQPQQHGNIHLPHIYRLRTFRKPENGEFIAYLAEMERLREPVADGNLYAHWDESDYDLLAPNMLRDLGYPTDIGSIHNVMRRGHMIPVLNDPYATRNGIEETSSNFLSNFDLAFEQGINYVSPDAP